MANALFNAGKQGMLNAEIDFDTDTLKAALMSDAYVRSVSAHKFLADVSASQLGASVTLVNVTIVDGVFDADDVKFLAIAAGANGKSVIIYKDTGNPATSTLLMDIDQITSFPIATNGGDITVQWDNGPLKIMAL